ncbi:MAG: hypothetical protein R3C11_11360 [Planctomycetaceae bacterium]
MTVHPPVNGQPWGMVEDLDQFVIASRHQGQGLFPISKFPVFIHIARPLIDDVLHREQITTSELENVAWGELYESHEKATNNSLE